MALIGQDYLDNYTKSLASRQSGDDVYLITVSRYRESGDDHPFSFQFLYNKQVDKDSIASVVYEVFGTQEFPVNGNASNNSFKRIYYRGCYKDSSNLQLTYYATYYNNVSTETRSWSSLNVDCIKLG